MVSQNYLIIENTDIVPSWRIKCYIKKGKEQFSKSLLTCSLFDRRTTGFSFNIVMFCGTMLNLVTVRLMQCQPDKGNQWLKEKAANKHLSY